MIQLLNNLLKLGIEYLRLKNQSFVFDKIDSYEKEKNEKIARLEELRDSSSNPDECVLLRERISELNKRIKHLSTLHSENKEGNASSGN